MSRGMGKGRGWGETQQTGSHRRGVPGEQGTGKQERQLARGRSRRGAGRGSFKFTMHEASVVGGGRDVTEHR
jgi:hypothetical protein